ncbi:unnamed protein product [Polarella glacialis]|uniref:Protein kinase domain-containing protein n=1 Tax=Polarella glacialis TaxID=89957 RepID=A0A813JY00_POLGL|nr:unnamed protein product [Polarella glacialis]
MALGTISEVLSIDLGSVDFRFASEASPWWEEDKEYMESIVVVPYLRRFIQVPVSFVEAKDEKEFVQAQGPRLESSARRILLGITALVGILLVCQPDEWPDSAQDVGKIFRTAAWVSNIVLMCCIICWLRSLRSLPETWMMFWSLAFEAIALSKSRYRSSFFSGQNHNTWAVTDAEFGSDAVEIASLVILMNGFYAGLPIRCSRSWLMILLIPAVYLAMTLPLPEGEIEGFATRRSLISIRLIFACSCGFLGRAGIEITDRVRFLRVREMGQELAAERVLRAKAEHEEENSSPAALQAQAVVRPDELLSLASNTTGRSSGATSTSSFLFKLRASNSQMFTQSSTMEQQLLGLAVMGKEERWLIDEYMLEIGSGKVLGQGSFGIVFAGLMAGTEVAIKMPKGELHSGTLRSVANELRILRHIRHPNVVAFYGALISYGETPAILLVEELIEGQSAEVCFLLPSPILSANARCRILLGICQALRYLHGLQPAVVHGDLKPGNVMVEKLTNRAKLLDFGLARRLTRHALPLGGSTRYRAPELFNRGTGDGSLVSRPSCSADIFSLGRVAFVAAASRKPFDWLENDELMQFLKAPILGESLQDDPGWLATPSDAGANAGPVESSKLLCPEDGLLPGFQVSCKELYAMCCCESRARTDAVQAHELVHSWWRGHERRVVHL